MKIRSFRVRIALLSVLCSSLVLLVSMLVALHILWKSELDQVDHFIGEIAWRSLDFQPSFMMPGPHPVKPPRGEGGDDYPGPPPSWDRPPWEQPDVEPSPRNRDNDRNTSGPTFIFSYVDFPELYAYRSENWPASLKESHVAAALGEDLKYTTVLADGKVWRVAAGADINQQAIVGVEMEPVLTIIRQVASAFLLTIPVALLLIALGAVFLAQRALRPVHELTGLVERITARGLGERVESRVKDAEFEKLILVFNQMMDRLERSFMQANRFSADAAHELRTPLTILQGQVERMLNEAEAGSPMQQDLGAMVDEIHRIKSILEKLLLLARMDAGQFQLHLEPLCLSQMVENTLEDIQALAPEIAVECTIQPGVHVHGDAALLETAIQNLGSNAVKYNLVRDGRIRVELARHQDRVILVVASTGPAIPPAEREKIFERFYRADKSRSRETDGLGLGLSLAREIVVAHQGSLELVESGGPVNRFELRLPLQHPVS